MGPWCQQLEGVWVCILCGCVMSVCDRYQKSGLAGEYCVSPRVRHVEELAAGGTRGFRLAAAEPVGSGGRLRPVCTCVHTGFSGQEAAGESEGSGPATGGIRIVHVYFYINFALTDLHPDLLERGAGRSCWCCSYEC